MTLYPQSKVRMCYNDVIRLLRRLTYCWLDFLYYILFKRGMHSRLCGCVWASTLNIRASSHSAEATWPSRMQVSQLSCPFGGDKCICRIMRVRSPGVKHWLFSPAITLEHLFCRSSPLRWCPQTVIPVKEARTWCLWHIHSLSRGGRCPKQSLKHGFEKHN